jgi:hypothetical protein
MTHKLSIIRSYYSCTVEGTDPGKSDSKGALNAIPPAGTNCLLSDR